MILTISWRNIWRNPRRSLVMVAAITAGLWGGLFAASLTFGLIEQRFETSIEQHISHIQMHNPLFLKDQTAEYSIAEWASLRQSLLSDPDIKAFSARTLVHGMLSSANQSRGISIIGVDPAHEAATTRIDQNIITGSYFGEEMLHPVLIGKTLAEKTKLQERSRLVLTFQDIDGELISVAVRVAGIFQTSHTAFDENNVYVLQSDLQHQLGKEAIINEVAVVSTDLDKLDGIIASYREHFPDLSIRTWAEISPEMKYLQEMAGVMLMIILIIILCALAFGLVNTMLMSVFERIRELGMLMAVGMSKKRIFSMIMTETTFLSLIGAAGGILMGILTIQLLGSRGLDLGKVGGDSLNEFGYPSLVYPHLEPSFFLMLIGLVIISAILTSVYPALKAIRLTPAEAVRKE